MRDYMIHDNATRERLLKLIEECSEVQKAAAKLLLHGTIGVNCGKTYDNVADLEVELGNLRFVMEWLTRSGDVSKLAVDESAWNKGTNIGQFLHYNKV